MRTTIGFLLAGILWTSASATTVPSFLVTNNDLPLPNPATSYRGSTATFYTVGSQGVVSDKTVVLTGGDGIGGGSFALSRIALVTQGAEVCVFVSNALSANIAALSATTRTLVGDFQTSSNDTGSSNGIGLAANASYLYASFSTTSTIATFEVQPGCTLSFVNDIFTTGLNAGFIGGMAINGATMVVTYGDGSIASFDISGGVPVANGDAQYSEGAAHDHLPNAVAITSDGHFAIFGDASTVTTIEVSDISSGKLRPTVAYDLGTSWNSGNVQLSPDDSLIIVTNSSGGEVTAAFFDKFAGRVLPGCSTGPLRGFYDTWVYAGGAALQPTGGDNGYLFVPEFGGNGFSSIGVVQVSVQDGRCALTEIAGSPIVDDSDAASLLSVAIYAGH
jgi:hypothetical protein